MTLFLGLADVLRLHRKAIAQSGGTLGLRDTGVLASALAQPRMSFGDQDFYPSIVEKASALGYSLILNHPFVDGNKRVGHLAMETFLVLNGHEIIATTSDQEQVILAVAAGQFKREEFTTWLAAHVQLIESD